MGRPKKIDQMSQIHGKDNVDKEAKTPKYSLDQILGDRGLSKYKQTTTPEYEIYLKSLNKSDLFREATRIGIVPSDNIEILQRKLKNEFDKFMSNYKIRPDPIKNRPISDNVKRILAEGR